MQEESTITKDMKAAESSDKRDFDQICKVLLSHRIILAIIIQSCLDEFKNYSPKEIATEYIEGKPVISKRAVHRDEEDSDKISGTSAEDATINEGKVTYDIIFTVIIPGTKTRIRMYVNIEAQNKYHPGYPLIKRCIYYCCRMVSAQYGREFKNSHYEKLKKVCSIWICTNPPKRMENSIRRYRMAETVLAGKGKENPKNYDLMDCVMICLGEEDSAEGMLRLLDLMMNSRKKCDEKLSIMHDEFDIEITEEIESEVAEMCNCSEGIEQRGIKIGRAEGRAEGIEIGEARGLQKGIERGKEALLAALRSLGADEAMLKKAAEQVS
jgi:hypothetical protein